MDNKAEKSSCCAPRQAKSCSCASTKQSAERQDRSCCCGSECGCGELCSCPSGCGCGQR